MRRHPIVEFALSLAITAAGSFVVVLLLAGQRIANRFGART